MKADRFYLESRGRAIEYPEKECLQNHENQCREAKGESALSIGAQQLER
jgi:hypothetical protein